MDKLKAMRTFVAIADSGSLTAAARALGGSLPAVVRSLAALEAELGARLFQRTTRRIALTEAGHRYLARCRAVQAVVDEAEDEVRAEQTEPQGKLAITAPVLFGSLHVSSGIAGFVRRYPKVSVEVQLLDRIVNLVEEVLDVGIRIGQLEDSTLIAQQAGSMRLLTVAAPSYLAERGVPRHPKDLASHNCIRVTRTGGPAWTFRANGKPLSAQVQGNFTSNQVAPAAQACLSGLGIGSFLAYQVAPYLAKRKLRVLLVDFEPPPLPIYVVYPEARFMPARTRAFVDWMKQHIANQHHAWEAS